MEEMLTEAMRSYLDLAEWQVSFEGAPVAALAPPAPRVVSGNVATAATIRSNVVTSVVAMLLGLGAPAVGTRQNR